MSPNAVRTWLIAFTTFALLGPAPQPLGERAFELLLAVHLSVRALAVWRRTRLARLAAGMVIVAGASGLCGLGAVRGYSLSSMPLWCKAAVCALAVFGVLLRFAESLTHEAEWAEYQRGIKEPHRLWDYLVGRDIPNLRGGQVPGR
jgi:hypothetical protein